jgi:hypothetical protein
VSARRDDLIELLAKVKAGLYPALSDWAGIFPAKPTDDDYPRAMMAAQAALGWIDAARALHGEVLPGYSWQLFEEDSGEFSSLVSKRADPRVYEEEWHDTPARAWLIAILKALIAEAAS